MFLGSLSRLDGSITGFIDFKLSAQSSYYFISVIAFMERLVYICFEPLDGYGKGESHECVFSI